MANRAAGLVAAQKQASFRALLRCNRATLPVASCCTVQQDAVAQQPGLDCDALRSRGQVTISELWARSGANSASRGWLIVPSSGPAAPCAVAAVFATAQDVFARMHAQARSRGGRLRNFGLSLRFAQGAAPCRPLRFAAVQPRIRPLFRPPIRPLTGQIGGQIASKRNTAAVQPHLAQVAHLAQQLEEPKRLEDPQLPAAHVCARGCARVLV